MTRLRRALSYGNVTATIAVFLAISGTAAAVTLAPANSVVSGSIRDGEVETPDIAGGAVTATRIAANAVRGGRVADGSLTGADLKDQSVTASDLGDGSVRRTEIAADAVNSEKIASSAVTTGKIALGAVTSGEINNGSVGFSKIQDSAIKSRHLDKVTAVVGPGVLVNAGTARDAQVTCPLGQRLIAGGYGWTGDTANSIITSSPNDLHPDDAWIVRGMVPGGGTSNTLFAWATCLAP